MDVESNVMLINAGKPLALRYKLLKKPGDKHQIFKLPNFLVPGSLAEKRILLSDGATSASSVQALAERATQSPC